MTLTPQEVAHCLELLERARSLDPADERYVAIEQGAAHLTKTAKKKRRAARKRRYRAEDQARLRTTGLHEARYGEGPSEALGKILHNQRHCYVCKQPYKAMHDYFHLMCRPCGDESIARREFPCDLAGRRALVTGGRVKIGYAVALALLRAGATVEITTRFPNDAAARYAAESDFSQFNDRLIVHGLDFRWVRDVLGRIAHWKDGPSFDILVNNAAQTVWHPPSHYRALWAGEANPRALPVTIHPSPDRDGQALAPLLEADPRSTDLERENSWTKRLGEIAPIEMVEVQLVNTFVPFLLCSQLKESIARAPFADRYVVNVSALEGQFTRAEKSDRHPHTNMAKAALNMLTRTSAQDYARDGIFMVSVDPGWMSHEGPAAVKRAAEAVGFHPPIEAVDCAARILDPIRAGIEGTPIHGVLMKDFKEVPW